MWHINCTFYITQYENNKNNNKNVAFFCTNTNLAKSRNHLLKVYTHLNRDRLHVNISTFPLKHLSFTLVKIHSKYIYI